MTDEARKRTRPELRRSDAALVEQVDVEQEEHGPHHSARLDPC